MKLTSSVFKSKADYYSKWYDCLISSSSSTFYSVTIVQEGEIDFQILDVSCISTLFLNFSSDINSVFVRKITPLIKSVELRHFKDFLKGCNSSQFRTFCSMISDSYFIPDCFVFSDLSKLIDDTSK